MSIVSSVLHRSLGGRATCTSFWPSLRFWQNLSYWFVKLCVHEFWLWVISPKLALRQFPNPHWLLPSGRLSQVAGFLWCISLCGFFVACTRSSFQPCEPLNSCSILSSSTLRLLFNASCIFLWAWIVPVVLWLILIWFNLPCLLTLAKFQNGIIPYSFGTSIDVQCMYMCCQTTVCILHWINTVH